MIFFRRLTQRLRLPLSVRPRPNAVFSALLRQVAQWHRFIFLSQVPPVATLAPANASCGGMADSRRALLARLATQPASGVPRDWRRDALYD
jgi:hypothetical protein